MNFDIIKESCIEYCRNTYALGISSLKKCNNSELRNLLLDIISLEDEIRSCDDINIIFKYKYRLENIMNRIEVIINA